MSLSDTLAARNLTLGDLAVKEARIIQHIPYAAFVDPHTISTKNGDLLRVFEVGGLPFETADDDDLAYRATVREQFLRRALGPRSTFYHHVVRRRVMPPPAPRSGVPFADELSDQMRARLAQRHLYENRHFATLIERPLRMEGFFNSIFRKEIDDRAGAIQQLESATRSFQSDFEAYRPRLLGLSAEDGGPLQFLSMLINGAWRNVAPSKAALASALSRRSLAFLKDMTVWEGVTEAETTYAAVLSLRGYGGFTVPGVLDSLLGLDCEFILSQSYRPLDTMAALKRTKSARRRMRAAEDDAETLASELDDAVNAIASDHLSLGEHQIGITVLSGSPETLTASVETIASLFRSIGAEPVRERTFAEAAFWAQLPGNLEYRARIATITSRNFADMASYHTHSQGRETGNHWGDAAALLETTSRCPYWFNWHDRDRGNSVVFGETGAGKTVLVNALIAMSLHLGQRLYFFDKDRGADPFVRAIDGDYTVVRPGHPTGFNPLKLPDTPENRDFVRQWLGQLLGVATLDDRQREAVKIAVDEIFDAPEPMRRLRGFEKLFSSTDDRGVLSSRLRPWITGGERAWLFDADADTLDLDIRIAGFDLTTILDDPDARSAWLSYVFHRINSQMRDGERTMIVLDEAWRLLDDEVFQFQLKDWLKTIRKQNGFVVFITQEIEDAATSKIGPTIIGASPTQMFLPNYRASEEAYCKRLGLTEGEFAFVKNATVESRLFLLKHGRDSVLARLDLSGMPGIIKVLSGRSETTADLERLRSRVGDNPGSWLHEFMSDEEFEDA